MQRSNGRTFRGGNTMAVKKTKKAAKKPAKKKAAKKKK
jgi:hypothetical protein